MTLVEGAELAQRRSAVLPQASRPTGGLEQTRSHAFKGLSDPSNSEDGGSGDPDDDQGGNDDDRRGSNYPRISGPPNGGGGGEPPDGHDPGALERRVGGNILHRLKITIPEPFGADKDL